MLAPSPLTRRRGRRRRREAARRRREVEQHRRQESLSLWPVVLSHHGGCSRERAHTRTPAGSWRMLGLPICCLLPVAIAEWTHDAPGEQSMVPVFICLRCCRSGEREAWDAAAPAMNAWLRDWRHG
jgi:hypothetical protein